MTAAAARAAAAATAVALALAGCGGGQHSVVPRLPGEGDAHTAPPRQPATAAADPWAGRALLQPPGPLPPRPLPLVPIERFALPGGLRIVLVADRAVPHTTVRLALRAGRMHEPPGQAGVAAVAAAAMIRGSARRTRAQLDAAAEAAGASLAASTSFETTMLSCAVPRADLATCVALLGEVVATPALDDARVREARDEVAASVRQGEADPAQLANLHLQHAMWGEGHPRGRLTGMSTLARIDSTELTAWHRARVRPDDALLLVVGDVDRAAVEPLVRRGFARWAPRAAAAPAAQAAAARQVRGLAIRVVDLPGATQGHLRIGQPGVGHRDDDFLAVSILDHVLGGGSSSRLATAVRQRLGPASAASSSFDRNLEAGALIVAGTAPSAQLVQLMRLSIDELARLARGGVSAAELPLARSQLSGGHAVRFDSPVELGDAVLGAALHGLDESSVRDHAVELARVDAAALAAAAARRLDAANLTIVLVGDGKMIGRALDDAKLKFVRVAAGPPGAAGAGDVGDGAPAAAVTPAQEREARAILDAALARKGGAERLAAVRTVRWKASATMTMQGNRLAGIIEKRHALPGKTRLDMTLDGGKIAVTTVLNGERGWARQAQGGGAARVIDFPAEEVASGKSQLWRDPDVVLLRHREPDARVAPEADVEVDGVKRHAIRVTSRDGARSVLLLIDKKTRQLVGMRYAEQGHTADERYGDFRAVKGVEVAHRRTTRSGDVDVTATLSEVEIDGALDAAVFARPADK